MVRNLWIVIACATLSCAGAASNNQQGDLGNEPVSPDEDTSVSDVSDADQTIEGDESEAPRCPIVPMALIVNVDGTGQKRMPFLALAQDGKIHIAMHQKTNLHLDPRGCVYSDDGTWVELAEDGNYWTLRAMVQAKGREVHFSRDMSFTVDSNGLVTTRHGDSSMKFEGFEERGLCAAHMMLLTQLSMFAGVSMAVVDGRPREIPMPEKSVCPDRRVSSQTQTKTSKNSGAQQSDGSSDPLDGVDLGGD